MPNYRYKHLAVNVNQLSRNVTGPVVMGGTGAPIFVDIIVPVASKEDLDDYMTEIGWTFVGTDLASSAILDARSFPRAIQNIAVGGVFTLTAQQAERMYVVLIGVLAANAIIEFPPVDGASWVVKNNATLGAFTVTLKVAGQVPPGIVLGAGTMSVWSDGNILNKSTGLIP